jgi:purine-binding chemotaxis protein CheW
MDLLVLALDNERYAIPIVQVREIVRAVAITRLPGAPSVIEGVVNLRGTLTPVFDLRRRFGLPLREIALTDLLVVVQGGRRTAMLRVESALGVRAIEQPQLGAAEDLVARSPFISGLAKLPDGVVLIHDVEAFLSESESEGLDAALASSAVPAGAP